jgi:hypothetical protein
MSNVISGANGEWDSEGQSAAFVESRRAPTNWPRRFIEYVSGHPRFYQRIPATLGFSNWREISHFGSHLPQSTARAGQMARFTRRFTLKVPIKTGAYAEVEFGIAVYPE